MKFAVHLADLSYPGGPDALLPTLTSLAKVADHGGISRITMMDHYFQMEPFGGPAQPMLEGYTSPGYLAGQTSTNELGLLVSGVTYRHPGRSPRSSRRWTCSAAVERCWVWCRPGTTASTGASECPSRPRRSGSSDSRRRCRSSSRCGATTTVQYEGRHYQLAETICVPTPGAARRS